MKWVLVISVLFLAGNLINAQPLAKAETALRQGNAKELSTFFTPKMKMCFDTDVKFVSAKAAEDMLTNFFTQHKPSAYSRKHTGGADDSNYSVGELTTNKGKYRVHMYFSNANSKFLIDEIRITPQR